MLIGGLEDKMEICTEVFNNLSFIFEIHFLQVSFYVMNKTFTFQLIDTISLPLSLLIHYN